MRVVQRSMVRVATPGGFIRETRLLLRKGVWAITVCVADDSRYVVTHLPTGACCSNGPVFLGAAKRLLDALAAAAPDWLADAPLASTMAESAALGRADEARAAREAFTRWHLEERAGVAP